MPQKIKKTNGSMPEMKFSSHNKISVIYASLIQGYYLQPSFMIIHTILLLFIRQKYCIIFYVYDYGGKSFWSI